MFKFIHIADVHLDHPFATKDIKFREILKQSQFENFNKVIQLCIEKKVDGLLIAGDLFESSLISFKTEIMIMDAFNILKKNGIRVFYATGNHDACITKLDRKLNWPSNVYIFDTDRIETEELVNPSGRSCKISGCGHMSTQETRNLVPFFPVNPNGGIHVGVLHTMVTNAEIRNNECYYLPCKREELEAKNYTYWALGHIHKRQKLGNANIFYSGNPQGLNSKELGKKGVNFIDIDDQGNVKVEFIGTSKLNWIEIDIDISSAESYDDLINMVTEGVEKGISQERGLLIIPKINLVGRTVLKKNLTEENNLNELEDLIKKETSLIYVVIKMDQLKRPYDKEAMYTGNHIVKEILDLVQDINLSGETLNQLSQMKLLNDRNLNDISKKQFILDIVKSLEDDVIELFMEVENVD